MSVSTVYNKLLEIDEIVDINQLFGEYNILAMLQTQRGKLGEIVTKKIKAIPEVLDTKTLSAHRSYNNKKELEKHLKE
ncbi:MAG: Lrp/AsnC family transcriptional regulator [Candidatus Woesearchaeota archaeon]|nr:MAG: Lrp/AsnC family transcriptional regulator [Candidatus Woesearchaeota archaeon]